MARHKFSLMEISYTDEDREPSICSSVRRLTM
jgi:hypothetical protein